jgi:hypothetical protein
MALLPLSWVETSRVTFSSPCCIGALACMVAGSARAQVRPVEISPFPGTPQQQLELARTQAQLTEEFTNAIKGHGFPKLCRIFAFQKFLARCLSDVMS